jgi:hypothetical protein
MASHTGRAGAFGASVSLLNNAEIDDFSVVSEVPHADNVIAEKPISKKQCFIEIS